MEESHSNNRYVTQNELNNKLAATNLNGDFSFKPVTHVIFDLDGLLVDSEKYFRKSVGKLLAQFNVDYNYQLQERVLGILQI